MCADVRGSGYGAKPIVEESDVVRNIGGELLRSWVGAEGVVGFDFDLPTRKMSRNAGDEAFRGYVCTAGARSKGDGFECAGGRK